MEDIKDLMKQLKGANQEKVNQIAWEKGSLPVRLAMLGLASERKNESALWWGYPPGVFIGYKWNGKPMQDMVVGIETYIRGLGYRVFLDIENLDEDADSYFQIPEFITSLQECKFYVLLLTELAADMITARKGKTSWIFEEYQHACRLVKSGRLFVVPVLLEPRGITDFFTPELVIDLTSGSTDFGKLNAILAPNPLKLSKTDVIELESNVEKFDPLFLSQQWEASDDVLSQSQYFKHTFDHEFRSMLLSLYTANQQKFDAVWARLQSTYGSRIVYHLYKGYCAKHKIPRRISMETDA